jgi:hypothetical protein
VKQNYINRVPDLLQFKLNFNGGELSSDDGLLMLKEFISALGIEKKLQG